MKPKILPFTLLMLITAGVSAQKKEKAVLGYAITASEKGGRGWKEVRQINIRTGEEIKTIYKSQQEVEAFNARTGQPIAKKTMAQAPVEPVATTRRVVNLDRELEQANGIRRVTVIRVSKATEQTDQPFSTNSAACAYDKKHERLYYTPMGIKQLRYIDLKSGSPRVYYFENEAFGAGKGMHDAPNQITRMVIAADGNGYALSNNADHLVRFTTSKKPEITDLGALTDDPANGKFSVRSPNSFGGDMIADASGDLYLITANRNVFKIVVDSRVATYMGSIKGLPKGFSTNGAMVESGTKVIVASSESTAGYYRFDMNSFEAEKISSAVNVYNASDLANANLLTIKKDKKKKQDQSVANKAVDEEVALAARTSTPDIKNNGIAIYPNPVVNGNFKLSFTDQPLGKYQIQIIDLGGKLVASKEVNIYNKVQVESFSIPELTAGGAYLLKVINPALQITAVNKLVVQ